MISQKAKGLSSYGHIKKSWGIGDNGQRKYYESCKAAGKDIKKTTREQDFGHVDFIVDGVTVDVKGLKDTHKLGQILLELKNVQGYDGWCSKSGPELIAFDFGAFFLHVKTEDLLKLVATKCDLNTKVKRATEALYKSYTRRDRQDLMTVVSLTDVIKECDHWYLPHQPYAEPMELL